jgi:ankyrin repeat protein
MSLEAERACDDAVVAREESTEYAEQLVALAARLNAADAQPTLGMANRSDLSARVSALLDAGQRRGRAGAGAALGAIGVMAIMVVAVAPVRAIPVADATAAAIVEDGGQRPLRSGIDRVTRALDRELYEAAEAGDIDGINEMLAAGANVNAAISGDGSPLIAAARRGSLDVARLLLDRGADPNLGVDGDGSPLIAAAERGDMAMAQLLLDRGANPNTGVQGDGGPLIAAAGEGRVAMIELLLSRGAEIDLVVPGDENPLIKACEADQLAVVKLLVSRGADVNARVWADFYRNGQSTGEWRTPLSMARRGGHADIVAFLIGAGARE